MFRTSDLGGKDGQTNHYRALIRNLAMKICFYIYHINANKWLRQLKKYIQKEKWFTKKYFLDLKSIKLQDSNKT